MNETYEITAEGARALARQQEAVVNARLLRIYATVRAAAEAQEFVIFVPRVDGDADAVLRQAGVVLARDGFEAVWLEGSDGLLVRWDTE